MWNPVNYKRIAHSVELEQEQKRDTKSMQLLNADVTRRKTSANKLIIADSQYASEDWFPLQTVSDKSDIIFSCARKQ